MTNALQAKLLAGILGLLLALFLLLWSGGRHIEITPADQQLQRKVNDAVRPKPKPYLLP